MFVALVAGTLALVVQTWAQAHLAPSRAAVVMTMEPVSAAAFAVALGGEVLTGRLLVGGTLALAAMWLADRPSTEPIEELADRLSDLQAYDAARADARSPRGSTTTSVKPCQPAALVSSAASAGATTAGSWSGWSQADSTRRTPALRSFFRSTRATRCSPSRNGST